MVERLHGAVINAFFLTHEKYLIKDQKTPQTKPQEPQTSS